MARLLTALTLLFLAVGIARADDWSQQGADPGMSKYASDNIPADSLLQLSYTKRFLGFWASYTGDYHYGYNVAIRGGQAVLFSSDVAYTDASHLRMTKFDWATGATIARYNQPNVNDFGGNNSFQVGAHAREIDSHHFTTAIIWNGADNSIYAHRGGDWNVLGAFNVGTGKWKKLMQISTAPGYYSWGGDATSLFQVADNCVIYRPGDTRENNAWISADISPSAYGANTPGVVKAVLPISAPFVSGDDWNNALRFGDIPKCVGNTTIIASRAYDSTTGSYSMYVDARNITTGQLRWSKSYASDTGGTNGFYTSDSDYWRFLASNEGYYACFSRPFGQSPTLHVLNTLTGNERFNFTFPGNAVGDAPLMASHNGYLYAIGQHAQYKFDATTGQVVWSHTGTYTSGYVMHNYEYGAAMTQDPLYAPMVLTNDTLWFIDGNDSAKADLVGMRTSDGQVIQTIHLADMIKRNAANESLLVVNDLVETNGQIGVLMGIQDANDPNPVATPGPAYNNGIRYQDLYVFNVAPEPAGLCLLAAGAMAMLTRRRK
jgi:outer membrane protein assembly factor BamB